MSTTLSRFKILHAKTSVLSPAEIVAHCYDDREDTFNTWCKTLGIELTKDKADRRVKVDRFIELVRAAYEAKGPTLLEKLTNGGNFYVGLTGTLRRSYAGNGTLETVPYQTLFWNNLFASLGHADFEPAETTEIQIEIAQVTPGVAVFPKFHMNDTVTRRMERHFLIRILSDIAEDRAIQKWFDAVGGQLYPADMSMHFGNDKGGADGLVWGFERGKDLVAKPDTAAFRKKHESTWWLDKLPTNLSEPDKEHPLKVVVYSVFVHPRWFPHIEGIVANGAINGSTAYY
jgi:hypothetical protein